MSNTKTIKQLNTDRVKEVIINSEYSTKNSLADATGLSVATCGNIIKDLLSTGEIIEVELSESTGGRRSRQFIYNKDYQYIAVLYVRVERPELTMVYSIQTLSGEVVEDSIIPVDSIDIDVIDSLMGELLQKYPNIKVLAFGVPGVVKDNKIDFCDVNSLNGLDAYEHFMDKFGIISIADNDVNMSALGYYNRHCLDESDSFAYIYYPTDCGPGAGIIVNGDILKGNTNFVGEVSYLPHYVFGEDTLVHREPAFSINVAKTIMTVNCLINPATVVISGYSFNEDKLNEITKMVTENTPSSHCPNIVFEEDIYDSYVNGLVTLAKEQLTCGIKIIKK